MRIGVDIDNVISAFDEAIYKNAMIYDQSLRNTGIVNPHAKYITKGMLDWSDEETKAFYANNMERISKELRTRPGCRKFMKKLIDDGHQLILITNRCAPDYKFPEETTLEWLEKRKIPYTKLVLSKTPDKTEEYYANKIDVMVDDRSSQCFLMKSKGVNCIWMQTKYNKKEADSLISAKNWAHLYEVICNWKKQN